MQQILSSVKERYPWSSSKKWVKRFICIFLLLLANSIYGFDLFSDGWFCWEMFQNSMRNYTTDMENCEQQVSSYVDCRTNFSAAFCSAAMKSGQTKSQCLDAENLVSSEEWSLRGYISAGHIMGPVIFILVCGIVDFRFDPSVNPIILLFYFICNLHFPFITKTKKMIIEWRMFGLYTKRNPEDNESYNKKMEELQAEEDKNQKIETFSMISETAIESVFQFWFQSQYLMPTLVINILSYTTKDGTTKSAKDLVNFKLMSILFSFVSIAWSAVKIRQVTK